MGLREYLWLVDRRPHHLIDPCRTSRKHHEAIESQCDAAGRRHQVQRRDEIVVDRIALLVDAFLFDHFSGEPPSLLDRVLELAKAVRYLDTTDVDFEPFGHARIAGFWPR